MYDWRASYTKQHEVIDLESQRDGHHDVLMRRIMDSKHDVLLKNIPASFDRKALVSDICMANCTYIEHLNYDNKNNLNAVVLPATKILPAQTLLLFCDNYDQVNTMLHYCTRAISCHCTKDLFAINLPPLSPCNITWRKREIFLLVR